MFILLIDNHDVHANHYFRRFFFLFCDVHARYYMIRYDYLLLFRHLTMRA